MIKKLVFEMFFVVLWVGLIVAWPAQAQKTPKFSTIEKAEELKEIDISPESLKFQATEKAGELEEIDISQKLLKFQATEKYWFDLKFQIHKKFSDFFNWRVSEAPLIRGVGGFLYYQFSNQTRINQLTLAKPKKFDQALSLQSSLIKGAGDESAPREKRVGAHSTINKGEGGSFAPRRGEQSFSSKSMEKQAAEAQANQQGNPQGNQQQRNLQEENQQSNQLENQQETPQGRNPQEETPPENKQERNQTAGIMLEYRRMPPSGKEQADIFRVAEENDLVKTDELPSSKLWVFSWKNNNKKSILSAAFACIEFNKFLSIKSCHPNYVSYLSRRPDLASSLLQQSPVLPAEAPKLDQINSLQTCDIIQEHQPHSRTNRLAGRYWAQNMIGSDLLRAEIQKKKHQCRIILSLFLTAVVTMNKL